VFKVSSILRIVIMLIVALVPIISNSADEMNDFERGKEAFNNELYQQALEYFVKSKDIGSESLSLTYNLAVTHYKLEHYEQSRIYFNEIRDNAKMTSLVEYNLGLIELKLNNKKQAITLFKKVLKETTKNKLKLLSKKQLKKLNYKNLRNSKPSAIKTRASISNGSTDNVTNIANGRASGESDTFTIVTASINAALTNDFKRGLSTGLRYFNQNLSKFNEFDFNETELKVKYNFTSESYRNYVSTFFRKSNLNSKAYQVKSGLEAKFRNKIDNKNWITYRYRYENIKEDSSRYLYLSGSKQQFRVDYRLKYSSKSTSKFRYQFETNDRNDTAIRSYSPQRHSLRYSYSVKFFDSWRSKTDIEYRKSDYPNVATQNRNDDRVRFLTALSYKISKKWNVQGRYEFRDNKSTDTNYIYKRNLYYLDLSFRY